jgi:hypothetical protein
VQPPKTWRPARCGAEARGRKIRNAVRTRPERQRGSLGWGDGAPPPQALRSPDSRDDQLAGSRACVDARGLKSGALACRDRRQRAAQASLARDLNSASRGRDVSSRCFDAFRSGRRATRHLHGSARYGAFNPIGTRTMDFPPPQSMRELDKRTVLVEFSWKPASPGGLGRGSRSARPARAARVLQRRSREL